MLGDILFRFMMLIVTRLFYKVKLSGIEHIPAKGGALIVSNHVTRVDALLLSAATRRRMIFVMKSGFCERSMIRLLFKPMRAIPLYGEDQPAELMESIHKARQFLKEGHLVCIFAEGAMTLSGNMHGFRSDVEKIATGTGCPVIPAYLGGAWGSIFSNYHGRLLGGLPFRLPHPAGVCFGRPMADSARTGEIRRAVMELSADYWNGSRSRDRNLGQLFVRNARRNWFYRAFADTTGRDLSFGKALAGSLVLRDKIRRMSGGDMVGVLLPSSVGAVLANIGITLAGRVPVNLNFTGSREAMESAIRQCGMKTVISSRAFVEKIDGMYLPAGAVFLEDLMKTVTRFDKIKALARALFIPARLLAAGGPAGSDDLATVIFSSGSTGEPKGVMLTHHNIISNIEAFQTVVRFGRRDSMCAVLPFFHSFGFTTTLWCPALKGFRAYYHASPLDGGRIAEMVREERLTVLLSTPTFLMSYMRRAGREDFATLRLVVAGAEKLRKTVADSFEDCFGVRPIEGYGATELSPVVSVNMPEVRRGGAVQAGGKEGSVGHPLPGLATKVMDPDTGLELGDNMAGLLLVKGPSVMKGYIGDPGKTHEVLKDGWYVTGDIVMVDSDGFIFIRDRLSRYSKIAGEMVPHLAVEDKINAELGVANQAVFISSASDERKGEQLVLFYTDEAGSIENLREAVERADIPNLWRPRRDNFVKLDVFPQLGSGKIDMKVLSRLAAEHVENKRGIFGRVINAIKEAF